MTSAPDRTLYPRHSFSQLPEGPAVRFHELRNIVPSSSLPFNETIEMHDFGYPAGFGLDWAPNGHLGPGDSTLAILDVDAPATTETPLPR